MMTTNCVALLHYRDFYKAADTAFQVRSLPKLEEVHAKASRHPELMEYVNTLKAKLGYRI